MFLQIMLLVKEYVLKIISTVEVVISANTVMLFDYYCIYITCMFILPDQRHICQRLNQFGHGKGTIHGG